MSEELIHRAIDEQWYQPRQTPASIHASRGRKAVIHKATRPEIGGKREAR